jgi:hypothetical protein
MSRPTVAARGVSVAAWFACLLVLGGCIRFWTTGADSIQITPVHAAIERFAPTASSPGVCNKGGSLEGCYDADARLIEAFQAMLDALIATPVPPRFAEGDKLLREAIAENLRGLELRNRAIAAVDNAAWHEQRVVLEKASSMIERAYLAFPEDNRPQPRP